MLTTTVAPTAGSARLAGYDVTRQPLQARGVSSVVFQEPVVDRSLSGGENIALHARLWGVPAPAARRLIADLVGALDLSGLIDRKVGSYSGGERRRLEIARALVSGPRVLFLDEPTVGLDPRVRHELLDVIASLRARQELTVLVTTHYLEEAQRLCDRVAIVHRGQIVTLNSPGALLAGLGDQILDFRVDGDGGGALAAMRRCGVADGDAFSVGARVTVPLHWRAASGALDAVGADGLRVSEIQVRAPTLDDVYIHLTGRQIGTGG